MHNNYHFLNYLSGELDNKLNGTVISQCFSQSRDELVIQFETLNNPFFIKASLVPTFTCLSFPKEFYRAKKNSIDLFNPIIGLKVKSVYQFRNERSFLLNLTHDFSLLFKMHGNRSNIILFEKEEVSELFKKNIPLDQQIKLTFLDRDIDWSYETFVKHHENPEKLYFTFGKLIWQYLESLEFQNKHVEQKWELICDIRKAFDAGRFYITTWKGATVLSLLKIGTIQQEFSEPIKAISEFYYTFTQVYVLQQEKGKLTSTINSRIQSSRNYIKKSFAKLEELTKEDNYKNWADIVMANLHVIQPGIEKVKLHDFYNNNELVEIKLKKDLNAQKNAELFYKKSKNQNIELTFLKEAIQKKEKDIQELETQLCTIEQFNDLKAFRQFASAIKTDNSDISEERHLPYHEFLFGGYRIWVGKNAQANDELTQRLSFKEDLWLHAKDVTGSHVLIKYQAGKNFPKDVIERAAQLAAYNSKRRNETLCPVIVTPKKFVRKKKGDPAGAVVIEREDIIMVEPKL